MPKSTTPQPPSNDFPELRAATAAYAEAIAAEKRLGDERVRIAQEAGQNDVNLARLDLSLILMAIVSGNVAIGKPTPEERRVYMIARLIGQRAGVVTKEELWKALDEFKDPSDESK